MAFPLKFSFRLFLGNFSSNNYTVVVSYKQDCVRATRVLLVALQSPKLYLGENYTESAAELLATSICCVCGRHGACGSRTRSLSPRAHPLSVCSPLTRGNALLEIFAWILWFVGLCDSQRVTQQSCMLCLGFLLSSFSYQ